MYSQTAVVNKIGSFYSQEKTCEPILFTEQIILFTDVGGFIHENKVCFDSLSANKICSRE